MKLIKYRLIRLLLLAKVIFLELPSFGQITPDRTVGTTVTPNVEIKGVPSEIIDGGTVRGANLFHSFSEFNIQNGRSVYFTNPDGITNIFSRITGSNLSNINGILGVLGNANLFLLNPNGIIFGANAKLDLNGSFIGTTANSIRFADGIEFSATNPATSPLLTVSVPTGLQMGENPGVITVQGAGHRLIRDSLFPTNRNNNPIGFRVNPGNTLALVGGDIVLEGGVLTAESGQIELGSVSNGTVNFNTNPPKLIFDYSNIQQFKDIQFSQQALADASGQLAGSIHLQGRNINFTEGSVALLLNLGNTGSGDITVNASESLKMGGTGSYGFPVSLLNTDNASNGSGGNLVVSARNILLEDGAVITARNFGAGAGGNVSIEAKDSIQILGFSPINPTYASVILTLDFGSGKGGDVRVSAGQLTIQNGGAISTITYGIGTGGDLAINASESIEIVGENSLVFIPSAIGVTSFNRGNTGQFKIDTSRLSVRDGATVSTATQSYGNSGNLMINAASSIEVSGVGSTSRQPSKITAGATVFPPIFQQTYGLPPFPTGNTGDLIINTSLLQVSNGGIVSVSHEGVGNAGNLQINANSIALARAGSITAATNSGEGGSMNLRTNTLIARNGSSVSTTAGGSGNGGNMTIDSPIVVGLENSDITANALQGNGGNIQITTEGIFLSADSNITASSQLGISGNVSISNLNLQPENLVVLPANTFLSQAPVIASSCLTQRNGQQGRFVVTGNGGLSETPDHLAMPYEAAQVRNSGQLQVTRNRSPQTTNSRQPDRPIQEATGWAVTPDGKLALVVNQTQLSPVDDLTCSF